MDWIQFIIFCVGIIGLFIWNRTESRADARHTDAKLESTRELVKAIHQESIEFRLAMLQESKDFHGKLERHDAEFKAHLMHLHDKK